MEKTVCIISFSPIYRDARVLRQIKYLSSFYQLNVIGYGKPHPTWSQTENIRWLSLDLPVLLNSPNDQHAGFQGNSLKKLKKLFRNIFKETVLMRIPRTMLSRFHLFFYDAILAMGRFNCYFYELWYWRNINSLSAFEYAVKFNCDAFHANDWNTLPIAAEAAKIMNAKLIFDAHEYAPLELENRLYWKIIFRPAITYFLKKYSPQVDASLTVAPLISERYKKEFDLDAVVVLNTPESVSITNKKSDCNDIRLIHHGGAVRDRRMERMIETLALCDQRFTLHFMLISNDIIYLDYLKEFANKTAPGRVIFQEPVAPEEIVQRISEYDVGFYLLEPNSYNNKVALPNKFFDFIVAGLAVCIGPSPSMAEVVRKYGLGCIAPSFDPHDVARTLNQLTLDQLFKMRQASREAAKEINAEKEMSKLVDLYDRLFNLQ